MKQYKIEITLTIPAPNDEKAKEMRLQAHNTLKWMFDTRNGEVKSLVREIPNAETKTK